jgi:hypothetical protein
MKVVSSQWSVVSKNFFCFALCAFVLCDLLARRGAAAGNDTEDRLALN